MVSHVGVSRVLTDESGWGSPIDQDIQTPSPTKPVDNGGWSASPPEPSPGPIAGMHPDRMRMLRGQGASAEYGNPRDKPPHMDSPSRPRAAQVSYQYCVQITGGGLTFPAGPGCSASDRARAARRRERRLRWVVITAASTSVYPDADLHRLHPK